MASISAERPDSILDLLIIGAGISGIGCACYLRRLLPHKRFRIIEARQDLGGTWDLFRYPGIRSDSDIFTFSYEFKPWREPEAIASGAAIMDYLRECVAENDLSNTITYGTRVIRAQWDSGSALWQVQIQDAQSGERETLQCRWIFSGTGYFDYDHGYRPSFEGEDRFAGPIIHPQHWPEDLDYSGKRIAVIGSGATAVSLLPALAQKAAHVTQIQRTPTYLLPVPQRDWLAIAMYRVLPDKLVHKLTRFRYMQLQRYLFTFCQNRPKTARRLIRWLNARQLPKDFDLSQHLNPPYEPWDQRLCTVPDNDLFQAISSGAASITTGKIERFCQDGVLMTDGQKIDADMIVTATGLNLKFFGDIELEVDGMPVNFADRLIYKGMMLDGLPNFCFSFGYTASSWTLKIDPLCRQLCDLISLMDARGEASCTPMRPAQFEASKPLLDLAAGYVRRAEAQMPRQTDTDPWTLSSNYFMEIRR
ncbi:MAG: NAD(P)/FAD-dependent oxidoreductase, partial [Mangrovicoccus sp.]|nr:NAD(P)/FAD-dependent oxidoreductase [Mangrovicoccus sp.]